MEERIGSDFVWTDRKGNECLNPYCNGRKNRIGVRIARYRQRCCSLNPYCNGRKNRIDKAYTVTLEEVVLILIVMEERIGWYRHLYLLRRRVYVLILIVMEERIG